MAINLFNKIASISIKRKITALFMLSITIMVSLSLWLSKLNEKKNRQILISNYIESSKELLPIIFDLNRKLLKKKLKELNLKSVSTVDGIELFNNSLGVGEIVIIKNDRGLFLRIEYLDESYHFFDTTQEQFKQEELITALFLIFDIALLIFIYLSVLKIVSPIKRLSLNMERFAKGNFDIKMEESGALEVAIATKSFNKMAKDLKSSFEDRENLLRYFGHEIRTPLTKAKYALEAKNLEGIKGNLLEIERFVEDVLNLHLITSNNLNRDRFKLSTMIVEALNRSKVDDESKIVVKIVNDFEIEGDLHYLSIALKNLIDNGLKYTDRFPIILRGLYGRIEIISYGEELKEGLEYYLKPFNKRSKDGFGLGLSLSDLILRKHRFRLEYSYDKEGRNIFVINMEEELILNNSS